MRHRLPHLAAALLASLLATSVLGQGQSAHLTVYDAGIAEYLEERTIELQPGLNTVEWRSLMPGALLRTLRVTADDAEVVRQDVTYDGPQVNNQRTPVLHLVLRNRGAGGPRRVQVDYLAPGLSWRGDYSLVLEPTPGGAPPAAATLDSWVSLFNQTGADVRTGAVDLIAGDIALLQGDGGGRADDYVRNVSQMADHDEAAAPASTDAGAAPLSAFTRFRLGRDLSLNANAPISRHPLFQRQRLAVTQRNVFENEHATQTIGRGGFTLLPRGLEVRLVAKNPTDASMPAGQVTVYARDAGVAQIVGQDRIPLTPPGGEFSVTQGRSSTLFGTRRVLERRQIEYRSEEGNTRYRLVTRIEVVLINRGPRAAEAFVREGIEQFADNQWKVLESSPAQHERLGANSLQFRVTVPPGGQTTVTYTVETR
jgi:hypothetical protein